MIVGIVRSAKTTSASSPLSLVRRLDAWARAFVQRPDVKVVEHQRGKPWKTAERAIYAGDEVLAFYQEANGYVLEWSLLGERIGHPTAVGRPRVRCRRPDGPLPRLRP